jgi:hypothetical protein
MTVVLSDTKAPMSVTLDETLTVAQLAQEISKKLAIKAPFHEDFSLRHIPKNKVNTPYVTLNTNIECKWLDPAISLREQSYDFSCDRIAFSRKYHYHYDDLMKNPELFYDAISVTFNEARSRYLAGEFEILEKQEDTMSNDNIELIALEAIGSGLTNFKDSDIFKNLVPPVKLKQYEANSKIWVKTKKDIEKTVQLKATKLNENLAQAKFMEQIAKSDLYKTNLFPAITKQGNNDVELLLGIGLNDVQLIHAKQKTAMIKFEMDEVTHYAGTDVGFNMITLVRGKQSKTEFDTKYGKQIENTLFHAMALSRNRKKLVLNIESIPVSKTVPTKNFDTLLRDFDLVKKAQDELFELERKMFNTGPLKGYDDSRYDGETVHPLPGVNNIESETMKKLVEAEAEVRALSMQKGVTKAYLDSTRVGNYEQSVPAMKKQLEALIHQLLQYASDKDLKEVKMIGHDLNNIVDNQLGSFINYENYLHSKYELLLRKREYILQKYEDKMKEEKIEVNLPVPKTNNSNSSSSSVRASVDVSKLLKSKDIESSTNSNNSPTTTTGTSPPSNTSIANNSPRTTIVGASNKTTTVSNGVSPRTTSLTTQPTIPPVTTAPRTTSLTTTNPVKPTVTSSSSGNESTTTSTTTAASKPPTPFKAPPTPPTTSPIVTTTTTTTNASSDNSVNNMNAAQIWRSQMSDKMKSRASAFIPKNV